METKVLELIFINAAGKKVTISVADPKEGLEEAAIRSAMEVIVAKNPFNTSGGDIVGISGARTVTRQVNEIYAE